MAKFIPIKTTSSKLSDIKIIEGQIIFTTDTKNIYIDDSKSRILAYGSGKELTLGGSSATLTNRTSQYKFILGSDGYFVNNNAKIEAHNSYVVARISFNAASTGFITLSYRQYAESSYDYALFGQLDQELGLNNSSDGNSNSTKVLWNGQSQQSSDYKELTYNVNTIGEHFFEVKYLKDSSQDSNDDSIKFKLQESNIISDIVLSN